MAAGGLRGAERQELLVLRQLEQQVRAGVEFNMKLHPPHRARGTNYWAEALKRLDEMRANGFKKGPGTEPEDPNVQQPTSHNRRSTEMAKLVITPEIEAHTAKAVAAALKTERKRVADALKTVELPEGTTARQSSAIMKSVKAAVAAPAN